MKTTQLFSIALTFASCIFGSEADIFNISHDPNDVHFYLYSNPNNYALEAGVLLDVNDVSTIQNADFIPNAPVKFIAHGFIHNYTCWVPQQLKDLYFQNNVTTNVIAVDWGKLAEATNDPTETVSYPFAAQNVEITGKRVEDLIVLLNTTRNIPLAQIHLIGYSLGAHVFGVAGSEIQKRLNQSVGRISGLDPAGPAFYTGIIGRKLKKTDATFVDVIHTSMGEEGIAEPAGDVDFYVNNHGLPPQPGCSLVDITCSHDYAPNVFMQSIGRTDLCACSSFAKLAVKSLLKSKSICPCGGDNVTFGDNAKPSPGSSYFIKLDSVAVSTKYSC